MTGNNVPALEFPEPGSGVRGIVVGEGRSVTEEDPARRAVLEQRQFVTGRISESVRYTGFGLLAIFYGIISSDSGFSINVATSAPVLLRTMAVLGVLAIFFDYCQYLSGRFAVKYALDRKDEPNKYNKDWMSYKLRAFFFGIKQFCSGVGCGILIYILVVEA
ncbi:MAG: hypothetical protein WBR13_06225 [Allosphingosinicella sp.]